MYENKSQANKCIERTQSIDRNVKFIEFVILLIIEHFNERYVIPCLNE